MNEQLKQIGKYFNLDSEDQLEFSQIFKPISLKKGESFIREGKISSKVGFIVKGSMMCIYNKDGEEYIDEFSLENEFITDYFSFLTETPATKEVRCLEDCKLMVLQKEDLYKLYDRSQKFERVGRLIAEGLFMNWQQKAKSLLIDNAEERYLKLIKQRPDIPQRVPQYLIASYLGVKPETVSRIRKKLSNR